jgi:hypothetical protein
VKCVEPCGRGNLSGSQGKPRGDRDCVRGRRGTCVSVACL